jgi:hypothetical protein
MLKQLDVLIGFAVVMSIVSMLIMAISQMVLSGLQLRGKQLMYALEAMFKTLKPDLAEKAKALAEAVLRHPVISDSAKSGDSRGLASAIRPEELLDILKKLGKGAPGTDNSSCITTFKHADETVKIDIIPQAARDVLALLQQPAAGLAQASQQLPNLIATLVGDEATKNNLKGHIQTLQARAAINVQTTLQSAEKWFGMAEDRAREWFATRAQQCNVVIALALAFGLQLDALKLYRQLESDEAYRTALVGSAAAVQKQAEEYEKHADKNATKDSAATQLDYWTKAVAQFRKKAAEQGFQLIPVTYPGTLCEFLGLATAKASVTDNSDTAATTTAPSPTPTPTATATPTATPAKGSFFSCENLEFNIGHLLGMLSFAALLSLGAPYWFNLLKTLTSFRPLLAQQVDKDKAEKKKKLTS